MEVEEEVIIDKATGETIRKREKPKKSVKMDKSI